MKDPYILPDGRILEIESEKFRAPEILFQPEKIGLECMCNKYNQYNYNSLQKEFYFYYFLLIYTKF